MVVAFLLAPCMTVAQTPVPATVPKKAWTEPPSDVEFSCRMDEFIKQVSRAREALEADDYFTVLEWKSEGEDSGVCFDTYGAPSYLLLKATFYLDTARCYHGQDDRMQALHFLVLSNLALAKAQEYDIPETGQKVFKVVFDGNRALTDDIKRESNPY